MYQNLSLKSVDMTKTDIWQVISSRIQQCPTTFHKLQKYFSPKGGSTFPYITMYDVRRWLLV